MKENIKAKRIKLVFADAAKKMIIEKGVDFVSVRKIAEEAGYVIGTLYNHFNSLDELLWLTRSLLIKDIEDYMADKKNLIPESIDDVIEIFQKYAQYYIENPEVYRFFYFKSLNTNQKKAEAIIDNVDFGRYMYKLWSNLIIKEIIEPENEVYLTKIILYSIHGILTLSLSDNDQLHRTDINDEIEMTVKQLLN